MHPWCPVPPLKMKFSHWKIPPSTPHHSLHWKMKYPSEKQFLENKIQISKTSINVCVSLFLSTIWLLQEQLLTIIERKTKLVNHCVFITFQLESNQRCNESHLRSFPHPSHMYWLYPSTKFWRAPSRHGKCEPRFNNKTSVKSRLTVPACYCLELYHHIRYHYKYVLDYLLSVTRELQKSQTYNSQLNWLNLLCLV